MKLCTCTRTCKRLGCCHLLYICLTQNLLHSNFKPLQNLNEISPIFVVDCPTQLMCTWIFICSMTKLKEQSRKICYYFCCHRHLLLLFSFFWRKGEDGEAAVCVSWGLIQLNNGLRRISGNIQLKEGIFAHFPKPQNKANQAISPWHLRICIGLWFPQ